MNKDPRDINLIGLMGLTGVGKSTLVDVAISQLGIQGFYEDPGNNPYIAGSYAEPEKFALKSQLWFLLKKHELVMEILQQGKTSILDMAPGGDAAHALDRTNKGNISKDEYQEIYEPLFDKLFPWQLVSTVIYMHAKTDTILKRISQRGREYETGIVTKDLQSLEKANLAMLAKLEKNGVKIIKLDTEHIDLANSSQDQQNAAQFVKENAIDNQ